MTISYNGYNFNRVRRTTMHKVVSRSEPQTSIPCGRSSFILRTLTKSFRSSTFCEHDGRGVRETVFGVLRETDGTIPRPLYENDGVVSRKVVEQNGILLLRRITCNISRY